MVVPPGPGPTDPPEPDPGTPPETDCHRFLWKPVADSGGMLVVLLPAWMHDGYTHGECPGAMAINGDPTQVSRYNGEGNGNRPTFRFKKPGAAYGKNIKLAYQDKKTSKIRTLTIPDGALRYEIAVPRP